MEGQRQTRRLSSSINVTFPNSRRAAAAGNEFLDLFFEVFVNLFGKIVVQAATGKQLFKPIHDSPGARARVIPSNMGSKSSLVAQCDYRIDAHGTARGNVTRQQGNRGHHQGYA